MADGLAQAKLAGILAMGVALWLGWLCNNLFAGWPARLRVALTGRSGGAGSLAELEALRRAGAI